MIDKKKRQCACCGYFTLDDGAFEICPVCYWEDDKLQNEDPSYEGGANVLSLNQAKKNFERFAVSDKRFSNCVRPPLETEM